MKPFTRKLLRPVLAIVLLPLLYVGGMIVFAWMTDYQPQPTESIAIRRAEMATSFPIATDTLSFTTWNIGYGGLGAEADFFYDGGKNVHSSEELVQKYTKGIYQELATADNEKTDFVLLQEVDTLSGRSYHINEYADIAKQLSRYAHAFSTNYNVGFVPVPFLEPMGGVLSGVASYTRYLPLNTTRYALEGHDSPNFPNYLFFLDRCYMLMRFAHKNGKQVVVVNTHNSAYGDGDQKKRQMAQLREVLLAEYSKGNYVIVGGDWNQCPAGYKGIGKFTQQASTESWTELNTEANYPAEGWKWAYDPTAPTNRTLSAPFNADTTYRRVLDFFLISPNVELLEVKTHDMNFAYSDHQPVRMRVKLR